MTAPRRNHGELQEKIVTSCASKNRYTDDMTAIASGMRQEVLGGGIKLYHYRCSICRVWHITHYERAPDGRKNKRCSPDIFGRKE